jgi:hypothetical protein
VPRRDPEVTTVPSGAWTVVTHRLQAGGAVLLDLILQNTGAAPITDINFEIELQEGVRLPHPAVQPFQFAEVVALLIVGGTARLTLPTPMGVATIVSVKSAGNTEISSWAGDYPPTSVLPPRIEGAGELSVSVVNKPTVVIEESTWSRALMTALGPSLVVKSSAGQFLQAYGKNRTTATHYIQLLNLSAVPANGTNITGSLLLSPLEVGKGNEWEYSLEGPIAFTSGLVIVASSTEFVKNGVASGMLASALYS